MFSYSITRPTIDLLLTSLTQVPCAKHRLSLMTDECAMPAKIKRIHVQTSYIPSCHRGTCHCHCYSCPSASGPHHLVTLYCIRSWKHSDGSCTELSHAQIPDNSSPRVSAQAWAATTIKLRLLLNASRHLCNCLRLYTTNVLVLSSSNITYHCYADDTPPNLFFPSSGTQCEAFICGCHIDISVWMPAHHLQLSLDKSELLFFQGCFCPPARSFHHH